MKKTILFSTVVALCLMGCGNTSQVEDAPVDVAVQNTEVELDIADAPTSEESIPEATDSIATLYITLGNDTYAEYPTTYTGTLTPELLISEISTLTGWNLDLADEVTSGAGGMTVSFADTSAFVIGPPEEQKEAFFCFDTYQLTESILNSVQHTLQYNFVDPSLGDPSTLDIYFCGESDNELYIPQIDVTVSMYEPYDGSLMD